MSARSRGVLIITADDYGYSPRYDEGILEAARAGAVDSVSAMVMRDGHAAQPLRESGIEVGLHLELSGSAAEVGASLGAQLQRFAGLYGHPPAYLDGHRHCHAAREAATVVAEAAAHGLPVRSFDAGHRRLLRACGVATPDRLIGRFSEDDPVLPPEVRIVLEAGELPEGVTEWMVHPGRRDPELGSSYDAGREEDLRLLLELADEPALQAVRQNHGSALG
jgi:chitin disaccharide deacetylase